MQNNSFSHFLKAGNCLGWEQAAKFNAPYILKNFLLLVWGFQPSSPALYLKHKLSYNPYLVVAGVPYEAFCSVLATFYGAGLLLG